MKRKQKELFLNGPEGVKIRRWTVGDDVRFTVRQSREFELLVAVARNGKFIWIRNGYS